MTTLDATRERTQTVEIERILPGGVGLARVEGRSVLVAGTAAGDIVEISLAGKRAALLRVVSPSADRVTPVCQDVDTCGGCDLMHLAYPAQLDAKRGILEDCLRRIGKLDEWPEIAVIGSPAELGYRWRAAFHVADDGTLGYVGRRSNDVVSIRRCHVLHPTLEAWRAGFDASALPRGERLSAMTGGERISVSTGSPAEVLGVAVGQERYLASADGFFQANGALVERLVGEVVRMAAVRPGDGVLDLYAGSGLFSLPLARRAETVNAVESDRRSIELFRRTLVESKTPNVEIRQGRVERVLAAGVGGISPDVVVLDPPRAGAGAEVVGRITALGPRRVVMVSCDPATFSRDVRSFADRGYELRELAMLDMFPQTHHLEVVALLEPVEGMPTRRWLQGAPGAEPPG